MAEPHQHRLSFSLLSPKSTRCAICGIARRAGCASCWSCMTRGCSFDVCDSCLHRVPESDAATPWGPQTADWKARSAKADRRSPAPAVSRTGAAASAAASPVMEARLHVHPLKRSEERGCLATCDVCRSRVRERGGVSWACTACDFDCCGACFTKIREAEGAPAAASSAPEGSAAASASTKPSPAASSAAAGSPAASVSALRLPSIHSHLLLRSPLRALVATCDVCKRAVSDSGSVSWACDDCDFDCCESCRRLVAGQRHADAAAPGSSPATRSPGSGKATPSPVSGSAAASRPASAAGATSGSGGNAVSASAAASQAAKKATSVHVHALEFSARRGFGFRCDACGVQVANARGAPCWYCEACSFDCCERCVEAAAPSPPAAPSGTASRGRAAAAQPASAAPAFSFARERQRAASAAPTVSGRSTTGASGAAAAATGPSTGASAAAAPPPAAGAVPPAAVPPAAVPRGRWAGGPPKAASPAPQPAAAPQTVPAASAGRTPAAGSAAAPSASPAVSKKAPAPAAAAAGASSSGSASAAPAAARASATAAAGPGPASAPAAAVRLPSIHSHLLFRSTVRALVATCDVCKRAVSNGGSVSWACDDCDFDCCEGCHSVAAASRASRGGSPGAAAGSSSPRHTATRDAHASCSHHHDGATSRSCSLHVHPLQYSARRFFGFCCDVCGLHKKTAGHRDRGAASWSCTPCSFDCCDACFQAAARGGGASAAASSPAASMAGASAGVGAAPAASPASTSRTPATPAASKPASGAASTPASRPAGSAAASAAGRSSGAAPAATPGSPASGSSSKPSAAAPASGSGSSGSKTASTGKPAATRVQWHLHEHPLVYSPHRCRGHWCDLCKRDIADKGGVSWACAACDFDCCEPCFNVKAAASGAASGAGAARGSAAGSARAADARANSATSAGPGTPASPAGGQGAARGSWTSASGASRPSSASSGSGAASAAPSVSSGAGAGAMPTPTPPSAGGASASSGAAAADGAGSAAPREAGEFVCKKGHALSRSIYRLLCRCDVCNAWIRDKGGVSWRCTSCDSDCCEPCAEERWKGDSKRTATGTASGSPSCSAAAGGSAAGSAARPRASAVPPAPPSHASPKAAAGAAKPAAASAGGDARADGSAKASTRSAGSGNVKTCRLHAHPLAFSTDRVIGYSCAVCKGKLTDKGGVSWACVACDFDCCGFCVEEAAAEPAGSAGSARSFWSSRVQASAGAGAFTRRTGVASPPPVSPRHSGAAASYADDRPPRTPVSASRSSGTASPAAAAAAAGGAGAASHAAFSGSASAAASAAASGRSSEASAASSAAAAAAAAAAREARESKIKEEAAAVAQAREDAILDAAKLLDSMKVECIAVDAAAAKGIAALLRYVYEKHPPRHVSGKECTLGGLSAAEVERTAFKAKTHYHPDKQRHAAPGASASAVREAAVWRAFSSVSFSHISVLHAVLTGAGI